MSPAPLVPFADRGDNNTYMDIATYRLNRLKGQFSENTLDQRFYKLLLGDEVKLYC